jgi:hypothetical protein
MSNAQKAQPRLPIDRYVPADHTRVTFDGGFWKSWTDTVRDVTIPTQHMRLDEEGFLEVLDFDKPAGPLARPIQPSGLSMQHFFDSDFGKWIEAASYTLKNSPNPDVEAKIDAIVEKLEHGQMADGYLNSWFIRREPERRWTNLRDLHEMYSMGHLLEGAVAYFEATGKRRFLDVMIRAVDHIIDTFGREPGKLRGYDAHEEIELALVKLYRVTRDPRHLKLATYFVDERGQMPSYYDEEARKRGEDPASYVFQTYAYSQAHMPVREQTQVVGHAVRAMYLFSAMADLAFENDDESLKSTCDRLFDNLVGRQLYVTGGLGPSASNEGFTREYDLPNETAYAETCAAVALGFFSHRMAQIELDSKFTDKLETVLYNGALSGFRETASITSTRMFWRATGRTVAGSGITALAARPTSPVSSRRLASISIPRRPMRWRSISTVRTRPNFPWVMPSCACSRRANTRGTVMSPSRLALIRQSALPCGFAFPAGAATRASSSTARPSSSMSQRATPQSNGSGKTAIRSDWPSTCRSTASMPIPRRLKTTAALRCGAAR